MMQNNTDSKAVPIDKKMPIYIELAGEPSVGKGSSGSDGNEFPGLKESVVMTGKAENGRIRQPKGSPKRSSSGPRGAKEIPAPAAAEVADSLPKRTAGAGKGIAEPRTPHEKGPDKLVKPDSGPELEQRSPMNVPSVAGETDRSVKPDSGPVVDVKNPDSGPDSGRPRGNGSGAAGGGNGDSGNPGASIGKGEPAGNGSGGAGPGSAGRSLIYAPRPLYPMQARRNNWEGAVLLEIGIGPDGRVQQATVLQSSGYPVLDRAAQKAIQKWRYRPAQKNGVAVASQLQVRVKFDLKDGED